MALWDLRAPAPEGVFGNKARNLAQAIEAGCPVPDAVTFSAELIESLDTNHALAEHPWVPKVAHLGPLVAVRSSTNLEDCVSGAAPGLFRSETAVAAPQLADAISRVVASARSEAVSAYRSHVGAPSVRMAVLVQRYIPPVHAGVVYTRRIDDPRGIIECHGERPWRVLVDNNTMKGPCPLSREQLRLVWDVARKAETRIGNPGVDVEWVIGEDGIWLVQARPIARMREESPEVSSLIEFSRHDARTWKLDATHNPDPMSPAQISLVESVRDLAPYDTRVVAGYLYTASCDTHSESIDAASAEALLSAGINDEMERLLAPLESRTPAALTDAITAYGEVFSLYVNSVVPLARALRRQGASVFGRALARAAAGSLREEELYQLLAPVSPAWDVSVPTYGETPDKIAHALARYQREQPHDLCDETDWGERDDLWFYRAQWGVRRAFLEEARQRGLPEPNDIFYVAWPPLHTENTRLRDEAQRNREERRRRATLSMPLAFQDGRPVAMHGFSGSQQPDAVWKGYGAGGTARGRVHRVAELGLEAVPAGAILLTRAVTPATLLAVIHAAAIVCEYGGELSHGAAMARELGIPCVIGCVGAWRGLHDGDPVLVDGGSGLVVRIDHDGL